MKLSFLSLLALLFIMPLHLYGCGNEAPRPLAPAPTYVDVGPAEALILIDSSTDLYIIDVSDEYTAGYIPDAINYSLEGGVFATVVPFLYPEQTYLIYSHDDATSISAAQMLIDAGFRSVYRLDGNFAAWVSAGFRVARPSG